MMTMLFIDEASRVTFRICQTTFIKVYSVNLLSSYNMLDTDKIKKNNNQYLVQCNAEDKQINN